MVRGDAHHTQSKPHPHHTHLILQEEVLGMVNDVLHYQCAPKGRLGAGLGHETDHHQTLHHQLPVLGIRQAVEIVFQEEGKLQFPWSHLEWGGRERGGREKGMVGTAVVTH